MIDYILSRLKEPSTFAGLAPVLYLVGIDIAPDQYNGLVQIVTGLCGFAAVLLSEAKHTHTIEKLIEKQ